MHRQEYKIGKKKKKEKKKEKMAENLKKAGIGGTRWTRYFQLTWQQVGKGGMWSHLAPPQSGPHLGGGEYQTLVKLGHKVQHISPVLAGLDSWTFLTQGTNDQCSLGEPYWWKNYFWNYKNH